MKANLISHLSSEEDKKNFKEAFSKSIVVERLREMMEKDLAASLVSTIDSYETPCWAYKQADLNGYRRCLKQWISLLDQGDK